MIHGIVPGRKGKQRIEHKRYCRLLGKIVLEIGLNYSLDNALCLGNVPRTVWLNYADIERRADL